MDSTLHLVCQSQTRNDWRAHYQNAQDGIAGVVTAFVLTSMAYGTWDLLPSAQCISGVSLTIVALPFMYVPNRFDQVAWSSASHNAAPPRSSTDAPLHQKHRCMVTGSDWLCTKLWTSALEVLEHTVKTSLHMICKPCYVFILQRLFHSRT